MIHVGIFCPQFFSLRVEKIGSCSLSLFPICGQHFADGAAVLEQEETKWHSVPLNHKWHNPQLLSHVTTQAHVEAHVNITSKMQT